MRIEDKTDTTLTLVDDQKDKKLGLTLAGVFVAGMSLFMAWEGFPELLLPGAVLIVGMVVYWKRSRMRSVLVFDRAADRVHLTVTDRKGAEEWEWRLSDVETAVIGTVGAHGTDSGIGRPHLLLKDGTYVPMRPYHAAGSQSWHAVAALKLFLGQKLEDAPVGWLPPDEFDRLFGDEMARLYKK